MLRRVILMRQHRLNDLLRRTQTLCIQTAGRYQTNQHGRRSSNPH